MTNDSMSEEKEDKKMGVACPLCLKRGKQSKVKLFQINYSEALVSCEDSQCPFPLLEGHLTNIVRRDFRNMKAEVPVPNISAADSLSDNSVCGSENSSQIKSASIIEVDESRRVTHSDVSATTNSTAVINTSASSSEVLVDKFDTFEFTATTVPAQKEKKRPKRKYYIGCRKRKSHKKSNSRTQNVGIEPES